MLPNWLPQSLWNEFKKNRKKLRAPMTEYAETLILGKLDRWKLEGADSIAILNESIENGWRGVFLNGHGKPIAQAAVKPSNKIRCRLCDNENWTSLSGGK